MAEKVLGTIAHVQIQREPLKQGDPRRYIPTSITPVEALRITPTGLVGLTADGAELLDVHNSAHPRTRNRGSNALSFGFTGHYQAIRGHFGSHLVDGVGGENVVIEAPALTPDELGGRLGLRHTSGVVVLEAVRWAAPCVEFSQFLAGQPLAGAAQREALQFLSEGRRGYYAMPTPDAVGAELRPGDALIALE